jgi:proline iminopeptidase
MTARILAVLLLTAVAHATPTRHPDGRFIQLIGKRIWVEDEGKHGPPLLLIPGGGGGSHDYYHPYLRGVATHRRVITFDGFGRGKSERAHSPSEYSFGHDVDEVEALRAALGIDRMHVLGHSYGAFVAEAYAVKYPQHVASLIVANGMIRGADWQRANELYNQNLAAAFPDVWAKVTALRQQGLIESDPRMQAAYFDRFLEQFALFFFHDHARAKQIVFDETTFNTEEYFAICGADCDFRVGSVMAALDFREAIARLSFPVLVLSGRADGIVRPMFADEYGRAVPRARVVLFEKSGHLPFVEETEHFIKVVLEHMEAAP